MTRKGIGGHHSARARTDVWLTPPDIINALGGPLSFDLDPCAAVNQPWPTAQQHFTVHDNGLLKPWTGRIWLNPPYSVNLIRRFLGRMAQHGNGISFIFARTETAHFQDFIWPVCDAVLFIDGRMNFHLPDGRRAEKNAGAPSILCAYGVDNADALAGSGIQGAFVPLKLRGFAFGFTLTGSWLDEVTKTMAGFGEAVALAEIYRAMAAHPKAQRNPNYQAKIRQVLQRGPFRREAPGVWRIADDRLI
jgi:hypothetical protein